MCETCAISVFNVIHFGEKLLTYVCGSKDRQHSKYILFHVFIHIGESASCFKNQIGPVLRGFQFYSICDPEQDRSSDKVTSLRSAVRPLNLDIHLFCRPILFQNQVTYTFQCNHI